MLLYLQPRWSEGSGPLVHLWKESARRWSESSAPKSLTVVEIALAGALIDSGVISAGYNLATVSRSATS